MKSLLLALLVATPAVVLAQGALTPAAAPAPTQRTLTQLAPRVPLGVPRQPNTTTLVITKPGSYVLMGNVTVPGGDAIQIRADDVTLDLNGFTVTSLAATAAGYGIRLEQTPTAVKTASNARITNGRVNAATFAYGVAVDGASTCIILSDLSVVGATQAGLNAGTTGSEVNRCTVSGCLSSGIAATTVRDSAATACGGTGINASGTALRSTASTTGTGLTAINAVNCSGTGSGTGKFGINGTGTASYCRAACPSGTALKALIAIGCSLGSGTTTITNKHEMP